MVMVTHGQALEGRIYGYDPVTLTRHFGVDCFPAPSYSRGIYAVSSRWLAYGGIKKGSSTDPSRDPYGALVANAASIAIDATHGIASGLYVAGQFVGSSPALCSVAYSRSSSPSPPLLFTPPPVVTPS
jgi:hypothetical protein